MSIKLINWKTDTYKNMAKKIFSNLMFFRMLLKKNGATMLFIMKLSF